MSLTVPIACVLIFVAAVIAVVVGLNQLFGGESSGGGHH